MRCSRNDLVYPLPHIRRNKTGTTALWVSCRAVYMSDPEKYRHHAAACLQLAARTSNSTQKAHLLEMARAWHNLIDQAERNSKTEIVYEPPLPKAEPQPQQQQQAQPKRNGGNRP